MDAAPINPRMRSEEANEASDEARNDTTHRPTTRTHTKEFHRNAKQTPPKRPDMRRRLENGSA